MSAANTARTQVRDGAPEMTSRAPAAAASVPRAKPGAGFGFAGANTQDQFKLNLSDIPQVPYTMDVEGFKPSLLTRLLGRVIGR